MSSSIAFGVHDHAAQFKGVRGSFLCAEGLIAINSKVQLHGFVAAPRRSWEGGWKGVSERAGMQRDAHCRNEEMNRRHKSCFSCNNK